MKKIKIPYWSRAFFSTGLILLAIGVLPLLLAWVINPNAQPVILHLLFLLVAPIGAVIFIFALIILLISLITNR